LSLLGVLRWAIALTCLAYLGAVLFGQRDRIRTLLMLDPIFVFPAAVVLLSYLSLQSIRYRFILRKCSGVAMPQWQWFRIYIVGLFLNSFVPQMGNVYRGFVLKRDHQISYTRYANAYLSFAWMDVWVNVAVAMIVIALVQPDLRLGQFSALISLGMFGLAVVFCPFVLLLTLRAFKPRSRRLLRFHAKLTEVTRLTLTHLRDREYLLGTILLGVIAFAQLGTTFYLCFRCFGIQMSAPTAAIFYAVFKISTYLNVTPGNLGVMELAYGLLSQELNIGMAEGVLVSAVFRALVYLVVFSLAIPMGGITLLMKTQGARREEV
jgi:uncharacterized protein (TIRG00374 family)